MIAGGLEADEVAATEVHVMKFMTDGKKEMAREKIERSLMTQPALKTLINTLGNAPKMNGLGRPGRLERQALKKELEELQTLKGRLQNKNDSILASKSILRTKAQIAILQRLLRGETEPDVEMSRPQRNPVARSEYHRAPVVSMVVERSANYGHVGYK
ncbi:hypothetical protein BDV34DRAFT_221680 [Aspergillus parasiticus]|uniref:Uncharacterized protein n=1 Tax=Aspergillus parasiticus TaxID=5067 RepID=A0A5N6DW68_ASPPA|nr:hypothetical protein BDV34DRAFT_221680 [Aspergillus parasiticus]